MASHFGPSKVTKCLENGLFRDGKWVTNGLKRCFCTYIFLDYLGCINKRKEPMLSNFGTSQGRKGPDMGPIWDHK